MKYRSLLRALVRGIFVGLVQQKGDNYMKNYAKVAALLGLSAVTLSASGWRIPEQSLNSTALSAAYVAGANGADASYYNPANMVWNDDTSEMELALTYINLPSIKYTDASNPAYNGSSTQEHFYVPTFHYVSPAVGNWRFGLSMVAPGGLSKRWDDAYAKAHAEEFTLEIIELNPTVAYKVNDKFAIGFGLRGVYTSGVVKSDGVIATSPAVITASRDMDGDSIDYGYNLALSYKPVENLTLSTTYRSKVDLTVEGDAKLNVNIPAAVSSATYNGGASVTIPLPASLAIAANYDFGKTNVEFVYERTYWSAYKELDFEYTGAFVGTGPLGANAVAAMTAAFDDAKPKNWKDANAYRIGVSHQYSDALKFMAGFAIDENGADKDHIGFELPESDAKLYSLGVEYAINQNMKIGLSYLYDEKDKLTLDQTGGINGTFEDASAHLLTASFKYKF
jgi:long-chain fatty acid transport protein